MQSSIQELVGRLENLHEIFRVQGEILSCGQEAVEPLAKVLLSLPSVFPEPRVAAAECLGAIGGEKAIDALIAVLTYSDLRAIGPVQRLAEETICNAAARQLSRFPHQRVFEALLASLAHDHLIGAGLALAELGDIRAIPYLIECLEDDVKKEKATEALRSFGHMAVPDLRDALLRPRFVEGMEPPLSQERRSRVAEILGQLRAREALPAMQICLYDKSGQVRIACAVALAEIKGTEPGEFIPQLIAGLEDSDLLVCVNCEEMLKKIGNAAVSLLAEAASGRPLRLPCGDEVRLTLRGRAVLVKILATMADAEAVSCLVGLLKDQEEIIRYLSARALSRVSVLQTQAALAEVARNDSSRRVRQAARKILEDQGAVPRPVTPFQWLSAAVWRLSALWARLSGHIDVDKERRVE